MVVLITGGCGYIGSFLARELPKHGTFRGETVRILDNLSANTWPSISAMPKDFKYELLIGDIRNKDEVRRALEDVDTVFHYGGPVGAAAAADGGRPSREVIADGTKGFLDWCISKGVRRFVNTSTGGVYGRIRVPIANEDTECFPEGPYSQAKLEAERHCSKRAVEAGMHIVSLRLATVSGFNTVMRMENMLHAFAILASIGQPLPVWRETIGKLRPFVDIRDVVQAFLFAASNPNCRGGVFNVCNYNETAEGIVEYLKSRIPSTQMIVVDHSVYSQNNFTYPQDGSRIASLGFEYRHTLPDTVDTLLPKYEVYARTRAANVTVSTDVHVDARVG